MKGTPGLQGVPVPTGHTPDGGVLVGTPGAARRLLLYEDPQCPYCRQFELTSGDLIRRLVATGTVSVEYRMRCFLGTESVRACNALASAAEAERFDPLRAVLFANQPPERSGGFARDELIALGRLAGLVGGDYQLAVQEGRYEPWAVRMDQIFQVEDPDGTPAAQLDGQPIDSRILFDADVLEEVLVG
jgi:hypothetical protein